VDRDGADAAGIIGRMTGIDALRIALLAVCNEGQTPIHRVHGELEHWLNRSLATDEIEAALADLEAHGLVAADRATAAVAYLTTEAGRVIVAERWEEFFPE
jgi:DNA-binding PadR family transcriptional regulator